MRSLISHARARRSACRLRGSRLVTRLRKVANSSVFFRSAPIASATPGYWILTATSRPSCRRAGVHLANRGSRQRLPVELGERTLSPSLQAPAPAPRAQLTRHRRSVIAQARQRRLIDRLKLGRNRWTGRRRTTASAQPSSTLPWSDRAAPRSASRYARGPRTHPRRSSCRATPPQRPSRGAGAQRSQRRDAPQAPTADAVTLGRRLTGRERPGSPIRHSCSLPGGRRRKRARACPSP